MILLELAQLVGLNPKRVADTAGGEYHSACPDCGGTDRFYLQPNRKMKNCLGSYRCRQCGKNGDSIQFARDFLGDSFPDAVRRVGGTPTPLKITLPLNQSTATTPPNLIAPPQQWIEQAAHFVEKAHAELLKQPEVLAQLEKRGIPLTAVQKYVLVK